MELTEYLGRETVLPLDSVPPISLSGRLEALVGRYSIWGEGDRAWMAVYYDAAASYPWLDVSCVPEHLVAFVSAGYRWGFVLEAHLEQFRQDTAGYGITCIPVSSFTEEVLSCAHRERLPEACAGLLWINDDFLYDTSIPFDTAAFRIIDTGAAYLNPKHFSVKQLIDQWNHQ